MQNSDISKQLSGILEDPEAMSRIMNIASSLMGSQSQNQDSDASEEKREESSDPPPEAKASFPDLSGADLSKVMPLLAGALGQDQKNDPRTNLLQALKPYMSDDRKERIDMLIKALRLAKIAGGFIGGDTI